MSRIFEALQHAEKERLQRTKSAEEQRRFLKGSVDQARTVDMIVPHQCMEYAGRISREGFVDLLFRLIGLYPWQCSRCHRCFHRFQRKPSL
jgi:hypothetical protein